MSWILVAQKKSGPEAFTDWFKTELRKWPKFLEIMRRTPTESAAKMTRLISTTKPEFIHIDVETHEDKEKGHKALRIGEVSMDEAVLREKAKEFKLSSDDTNDLVEWSLESGEKILRIPRPHVAWPTEEGENRPVTLPQHMAPERPTVTEEQIERGAPPAEAAPAQEILTPEERKAKGRVERIRQLVAPLIERYRQSLQPAPFVPPKEGAPGEMPPEELERLPRKPEDLLPPGERKDVEEVMREMVHEGLLEPQEAPKTQRDFMDFIEELIDVGGARVDGDKVEVDPSVADAMTQEQVGQLIEELTRKVRDPKKVAVKIKVSR